MKQQNLEPEEGKPVKFFAFLLELITGGKVILLVICGRDL